MPNAGLFWFWEHYNLRKLKYPRVIILPNGDIEIAVATGGDAWNRKYIRIEGVVPNSSLNPIYTDIINYNEPEQIIII